MILRVECELWIKYFNATPEWGRPRHIFYFVLNCYINAAIYALFSEETLLITISAREYADKLVDHSLIKINAIAHVLETRQTWSEEDDFPLIKPDLELTVKKYIITLYHCIILDLLASLTYLVAQVTSVLEIPCTALAGSIPGRALGIFIYFSPEQSSTDRQVVMRNCRVHFHVHIPTGVRDGQGATLLLQFLV